MKTSFYFFFWFIIYFLIELTGIPFLIQNGFLVALILIFIIIRLDKKLFAPELTYQTNLNRAYIFEIFYTKDDKKMAKILARQCISQSITAIYCIITVVGLWALSDNDVVAYLIFGFLAIVSMIASSKLLNQYRNVKRYGIPDFSESQFSEDEEAYSRYCNLRQSYTAKQLLPKAPKMSKWVNIVSIIFA